jgi:hypothetical protein
MRKIPFGVVHIGTEKTGTTTIQDYCALNRNQLNNLGFHYPKSLGGANHIALAALSQDDPPKFQTARLLIGAGGKEWGPFKDNLLKEANEELSNLPTDIKTVVFSNEHLHSNLLSIGEVKRLKSLLENWVSEVKVIVYLRRQDLLAQSLYSTRLKGGEVLGSQPIVPSTAYPAPYYYQYHQILENYASAFGKENILVRIFEKDKLIKGDLLDDFFSLL